MNPNVVAWDGSPGHYEAHFLTATDAASGLGFWIRYSLHAPLDGPAEGALWFMTMDRAGERLARRVTCPADAYRPATEPFGLALGNAELSDRGMAGAFEDVAWELSWQPGPAAGHPVHPLLRRTWAASSVLVLSHPDLAITGTLRAAGRELVLDGARGVQAHVWGSRHARRWTWAHACDLHGADGLPRPGAWIDAVSAFVPRLGREIGPSTPVVGLLDDAEFRSTSPLRVLRNPSAPGLTGWRFGATAGSRRVLGEVAASRGSLVGVTYHDPDGSLLHCYNSEVATLRLSVWDRRRRRSGWLLRDRLSAIDRAHFEYAQPEPVAGVELLIA